ncbi:HlyD family secretion protein [Ferrimonas gelatinilytica]|uniref:HlyD family secretion protein n=1 Tax=Ferrimonas gelatinilytica TaxID=1255257 RepID=A0ABP9S033_9GAMM
MSNNDQEKQRAERSVQRITTSLVMVCVVILAWYLAMDRLTPTTDNARIRAFVQPMSSEVSGRLKQLKVKENQEVQRGQLLAQIDPERYKLAVAHAEAELELAGQSVGANTANIAAAQAQLVEAQTNLERIRVDTRRLTTLSEQGYVSQTELDNAVAQEAQAEAAVRGATAALEVAKQTAGISGNNNPQIQRALAALSQAQRNLEDTEIRAPRDGLISNLRYDIGVFSPAGQPLFTFISTKEVWIESYMRENNLTHIRPGDPVELVLDSAPGQVFHGSVITVSRGVTFTGDNVGSLPSPPVTVGWLREPQRFPVLIRIEDKRAEPYLREGGQTDVVIYTEPAGWLITPLAKFWIRLMSLFSYVY